MKSMKFLSLSLLLVSCSFAAAMDNDGDAKGGDVKVDAPKPAAIDKPADEKVDVEKPLDDKVEGDQQKGGNDNAPTAPGTKPEKPAPAGLSDQALNYAKDMGWKHYAGLGTVVAAAGAGLAYKYNPSFKEMVDNGVDAAKAQYEAIRADSTKSAIALGVGGTVVLGTAAYATGAGQKAVSYFSGSTTPADQKPPVKPTENQ